MKENQFLDIQPHHIAACNLMQLISNDNYSTLCSWSVIHKRILFHAQCFHGRIALPAWRLCPHPDKRTSLSLVNPHSNYSQGRIGSRQGAPQQSLISFSLYWSVSTKHLCTVVDNSQEYRLQYWATRSSVRSFAHSFACSRLLASLAPSAALTRSLARTLRLLPRSWDSDLLDGYFVCVFSYFRP